MENQFELLRDGILKMQITTVKKAQLVTGLSPDKIINFVRNDPSLRIFDNENGCWINESAAGHC
ncbi:hypothetical protein [Lactococcus fujiensis]|uniref:Uncharacterized protein n=1 Tax=Lactococcus fujiensis JCM 16395 TaxID=1291764 RepID=A0A2A5RK30_9LACT|nr:hypothetical protein [Lactococcus fujiensis]PCR99497.1 hypothetical protein RT41_GL001873 [Lactococcus fujiensis JCM 16395]